MAETASDPNCVEPACASKVDLFRSFVGDTGKAKTKGKAMGKAKVAAANAPKDCPLGREDLGTATWGLLHSMSAYYPEKPSPEYQAKAKTFVEALALMYPCVHCAEDFQKEIQKSPPRVDSRTTFSMWLCEQHNVVNRKIHKPLFECTMDRLDERWRKGRPECWGKDADPEVTPASLGKE